MSDRSTAPSVDATSARTSGEPVLSFDHVTIQPGPLHDTAVCDVNLYLRPGDLMLLRLEKEHTRLPLADAAQGLMSHANGEVRFLGAAWDERTPDEAAELRGRIGRVFADDGPAGGWVSDLSVSDNVTLARRHHSRAALERIEDEAAALARVFGLPGLPRGRPARVHRQDLQRAACVRAFLGNPVLLILEQPTEGVYPDIMPPLVNALRAARDRGAAVLWSTSNSRVWADTAIRPSVKCLMSGSQMLTTE